MYCIGENVWKRRHDELMDYLKTYMDIEEVKTDTGRYSYKITGNLPPKLPPLPRKNAREAVLRDYDMYVQAALGEDFKPNSKAKIARDAINDFAEEKYGHTSEAAVVRRYVKPVVDKRAVIGDKVWVNYNTYMVLNEDEIRYLKICFKDHGYTAERTFEAVTRTFQGAGDLKELEGCYRSALNKFKDKYNFYPILVHWMKIKGQG